MERQRIPGPTLRSCGEATFSRQGLGCEREHQVPARRHDFQPAARQDVQVLGHAARRGR